MKKESLELFWLNNSNNITAKIEKNVRHRDCAFSAIPMLEKVAHTLSSTPHIIAITLYTVLLFRLFAQNNFQILARSGKEDQLIKLPVIENSVTFSQFVQNLIFISAPRHQDTTKFSLANLELATIRNKLLFCFESSSVLLGEYLAATMIKRYRELLKQIYKNPHSQINTLDITISKEKKLFKEMQQAHLRHQKSRNACHIIEQQIALIPACIAKEFP